MTGDRYYDALQRVVGSGILTRPADDVDLQYRLATQAASGSYQPPAALVEERQVPGTHGPVAVRIYRPLDDLGPGRPLLVWCHGGAWVGGDLDMPEADATAREVVVRAGAVVVSVDYRLAVDGTHFPVPLDDVLSAYDWAMDQVEMLGASPARVALGGASAGANLAAGACVRLRDERRAPARAVLAYPVVHPALPAASSELEQKLSLLSPAAAFHRDVLTPVVENYLGAPLAEATPYAMAGLADLAGLPPTLIINCEYDGLRASGEQFARQLTAARVPVRQVLAADVLHGHINAPWLPQAQQTYADIAAWVAE